MREIQLRDAKARLSAVVDDAVRGEPAIITRHGNPEAVILSFWEWQCLTHAPSFGQLLRAAPLENGDLPPRNSSPLRDSGLWALYLVDTNVTFARAPSRVTPAEMAAWIDAHSAKPFLSVVTIVEVEDGIAKPQCEGATRKSRDLSAWLETVLHLYAARILPFDLATARIAGVLSDRARGLGRAPDFADIMIAATAQSHGLTILTRNLRHFEPLGVPVHNLFAWLPEA